MDLVIVESPTKAQTIKKVLSKKGTYEVIATKGHILNLPQHELGIEISKDKKINAKWVYEKGKREIIHKIRTLANRANNIYIATDDDREGEKIAYDVVKKANLTKYKRVVFLEITENEILKKISKGRDIDINVVDAAIARRLIDRYIGYPISTIVKQEFRKKKSLYIPRGVGRVISPSLHILVELEKKIESFVAEPQYKVAISYSKGGMQVIAKSLLSFPKEAKKEFDEFLYKIKTSPHIVEYYKQKTEDREPPKPLITSTLQYGAWYLYRIKPKETMKIAQELFEKGYITYHRTDSYRISEDAARRMIKFLYEQYGDEYVVSNQRHYEKSSNAQDAHEAIRPTYFDKEHMPESIAKLDSSLTKKHLQIYEFIWYRTIATQIKAAVYDVSNVEINVGGNIFKAQANHRIFDGWERFKGYLIKTSVQDEDEEWKNRDIQLPEFEIGEELIPLGIKVYDTIPHRPKRYGVGRFITTLSRNGIARPSTLDTIIDSLEKKGYIKIIKGLLYPQQLGIVVDEWLEENVNWLIDIELAKRFEEQLDEVEKGEKRYWELIFEYIDYIKELEKKFNLDVLEQNKPTPAQIDLIYKIAKEKGIKVNEGLLNNKKLAEAFINAHMKEKELGKCSFCKQGNVYDNEKVFKCSKCDFVLFKSSLAKTLEHFDLPSNEKFQKEFVRALIKHKKIYFEELTSSKGKKFGAFLTIKKNKGYYNIELSFPKKEVDEKTKEITKEIYKNAGIDIEKIILKREVEKLREERRLLQEAALKDRLTRAYNRSAFEEDIKKLNVLKNKISLNIAFIDGDKFKRVNDTYGHQMGDEVLKIIINKIFETVREYGFPCRVYRYGGEEFVIMARDVDDNTFYSFLETIRQKLENHQYDYNGQKFIVTTSIGWIDKESFNKSINVEEAVKKADEAVYIAKETGRNKIVKYREE